MNGSEAKVSRNPIPARVQEFIFDCIDSVDQLETLLLLRSRRDREWTAHELSSELRNNPALAAKRLAGLKALHLLQDNGATPPAYRYSPATSELEQVVTELAEVYAIRPHKIHELIFSSLKAARKFLNAFTVTDRKENDDD